MSMRVAAACLAIVVMLAPLALGSNRPLTWSYNAMLIGLVLAVTAGSWLASGSRHPHVPLVPVVMPLAGAVLVSIWVCVQLLPVDSVGASHPVWAYAGNLLPGPANGRISINPSETVFALLRLASHVAVFLAAYVIARDAGCARILLWMLVLSGAAYAAYGLAGYVMDVRKVLWFDNRTQSTLTGTFLNRNHAAMHLGMVALAGTALILQAARGLTLDGSGSSSRRANTERGALVAHLGLLGLVMLLVLSALVATASRGGLLFAGCGAFVLLFIMILSAWQRGGQFQLAPVLPVVLVGAILTVIALLAFGEELGERLLRDGFSAGSRLQVYSEALGLIADNALAGTGLATFQDAYPAVREFAGSSRQVWDKAHNDYLEVLLELGLPVGLFALASLLAIVLTCFAGVFRRRRNQVYCALAVAVAVQVGLHELVDFGLQLQANTMTFAMILGIGVAQSVRTKRPDTSGKLTTR